MDFQFWVYVIFAVVWVLIRALRKNPKRQEYQGPAEPETESPNKPISFEELLREIQQSKTPPVSQPEPKPAFKPTPAARSYDVDYDDDIEEEEQDLETIPTRKETEERTTALYEEAKRQAFQRKSLEETMTLADTEMKFSHFKGYEEAPKTSAASEFLKDFKDPEGFKKAFIMSEILKKKF
ncbi:MAG TPA: hypothetical protein VFE50_21885 [Cyclobacteriaceae bacterium]|nr:hypothetical protein [Cyclobacteriaceae bacterium]